MRASIAQQRPASIVFRDYSSDHGASWAQSSKPGLREPVVSSSQVRVCSSADGVLTLIEGIFDSKMCRAVLRQDDGWVRLGSFYGSGRNECDNTVEFDLTLTCMHRTDLCGREEVCKQDNPDESVHHKERADRPCSARAQCTFLKLMRCKPVNRW